ncbi:conserved hypothetical protein [Vibrio owensii]|uniref:Type III secretion protein n=1 Tax=Vibrio owensii TaxID=696485 RepID=A0AAU9Q5M3_9VIBR|nr:conserved hypothetical protein [Vibrio owensii]
MNNIPRDFYNSITQALTHRAENPSSIQPERQQMKQHLQQEEQFYSSSKARNSRVFAHSLNQVNDNLISHEHKGFPAQKAEGYINLASDVYRGKRSNASAFAESSGQWLDAFRSAATQKDKIDCAVGAGMNAGGALFAGALDSNDYKTGKAFHSVKE